MEIAPSSKSKPTEYDTSLLPKYPSAKIGPYKLGEDVVLRCISRGGQPLPNVTWWKDNSLLGNFLIVNQWQFQKFLSQERNIFHTVILINYLLFS